MGSAYLEAPLSKTGDAVGSPIRANRASWGWGAGCVWMRADACTGVGAKRIAFQKRIESVRGATAAMELLINLGILITRPSALPAWRAHEASLFIENTLADGP